MFERLDQMEARYEDLGKQLSDPNIVSDQENYRKVSKQHRDMEPAVEKFREYRALKNGIADAKAMLAESDPDIKEMAQGRTRRVGAPSRTHRRSPQSPAAPERPQRREERHPRTPRRHRRRRGRALRSRGLPHVPPLRRAAPLESRNPLTNRDRHRPRL